MPVKWGFEGRVLTLSINGVVANQDIDVAMREAITNAPSSSDIRLLWDSSDSLTPASAEDIEWRLELVSSLAEQGLISRVALLLGSHHGLTVELARQQLQKGLRAVRSQVFTDATKARSWLVSSAPS